MNQTMSCDLVRSLATTDKKKSFINYWTVVNLNQYSYLMALNLPHSFTSSSQWLIDRLTIQSVLREPSLIAMLSRKESSSNCGAPKRSSVATWQELAEWTMFCARDKKTFQDGTTTTTMLVKFYATMKKFAHQLTGIIPFLRTIVTPNSLIIQLLLH